MDLRKVDLNLLVAFDALLTARSVSTAAKKLGVTQPALSHALKRLRMLFNDQLLVRGSNGMQPTARALALHPPVTAALAELHSILSSTAEFEPGYSTRKFRIGMSDVLSVEALPLIARRIRREAPNVDLIIKSQGPREAYRRISDDDLDMAIGVFPQVPHGLIVRELYRDQLVCIADERNSCLRQGRLSRQAYLQSPHVTVAPNHESGIQLDEILDATGISRRVAIAVPHYLSVPAVIKGTDLIGHSARRLLAVLQLTAGLAVFPVPLPVSAPELVFIQIWHRRYEHDPGHRWLRDLVFATLHPKQPLPARVVVD
jgi:DNA-binding transcriptional LysR family regulator